MSGAKGVSSPPANTVEWEEMICSTKVEPERGIPTTKIGAVDWLPEVSKFHVGPCFRNDKHTEQSHSLMSKKIAKRPYFQNAKLSSKHRGNVPILPG